jgi:hypothetical protein
MAGGIIMEVVVTPSPQSRAAGMVCLEEEGEKTGIIIDVETLVNHLLTQVPPPRRIMYHPSHSLLYDPMASLMIHQ